MSSRRILRTVLSILVFTSSAPAAQIDYSVSFEEADGYELGGLNGQQGWIVLAGLGDHSFAEISDSAIAHDGSRALLLRNNLLVTETQFVLRQQVPKFSIANSIIEAKLNWAPVSNTPESKVYFRVPYAGSEFHAYGQVYKLASDGSYGILVGVARPSGGGGIGDNPPEAALFRWNELDFEAGIDVSLQTGERFSWASNSVSNATGSIVYGESSLELLGETDLVEWFEIVVDVKPQSSVALDSVWWRVTAGEFDPEPQSHVLAVGVQPAVELTWGTQTGKSYQLQWAHELNPNSWRNLGAMIDGTGSVTNAFDTTSDTNAKVYRVVEQ